MQKRQFTRRRVLVMGSALAATTLLAACGEADDEPNGGGSGGTATPGDTGADPTSTPGAGDPTATPKPDNDAIEHPTDAETTVIRIALEGGFMMPAELARRLPIASLHGDGRLFLPGPQIEIYPPPALQPVLVTQLNDEGIQTLLASAEERGFLDGDADYSINVTDVPQTVIAITANGKTTRITTNALGMEMGLDELDDDERDALDSIQEFINEVTGAPMNLPESAIEEPESEYEVERMKIIVHPYQADLSPEIEPSQLDWPLEAGPAEIGVAASYPADGARCAVIEGAELDPLMEALAEASTITQWIDGADDYSIVNRPLLPGEEGCEEKGDDNPDDDDKPSGDFEYPTGADEVVVRYSITGGFVPMEYMATHIPEVSIFGDGMIVTPGAQIMIYPPPAMPALSFNYLSDEGIQAILAEAEAAGLMQGDQTWDELGNSLADAGTGVLTITANGQTSTVSVYAPGSTEMGDLISPEEEEFRERFDGFIEKLVDAASWLPEGSFVAHDDEYPLERLQIASQPASVAARPDEGVEPGVLEWPLETPLSELGEPYFLEESRVFILEGEEFNQVVSMLWDANSITRWESDGEEYVFHVRPLLPDEEGPIDPMA